LAGPATNAATLSVISSILGKKSTLLCVLGIMLSSLFMGFVVDAVYSLTDLTAGWHAMVQQEHPSLIGILSALVLFGLVLFRRNRSGCPDPACKCG
jgi:hypothetical protein